MGRVITRMSFMRLAAAGIAAIGLGSFVEQASATPVYDTAVGVSDFTGSRSIAGGGLINGGGTFTSATLSWTITPNVGFLHYSYNLATNSQQGISHFILDLSDNCAAVGDCFQHLVVNSGGTLGEIEFDTFSSTAQGNSNPGMAGPITGAKANISSGASNISWEFDSNRDPVWEDFYAKGGNPDGKHPNGFSVFNAGLNLEGTDSNTGHFVAMPDTVTCTTDCGTGGGGGGGNNVPEPSTTALLGAGLLGFGLFGRRRQRARQSA
jgi:hypothetical protein